MSTDAQFTKGEIVWYINGKLEDELAVITEVTQVNPAQYHIVTLAKGEHGVCGEGIDEPGAVKAL